MARLRRIHSSQAPWSCLVWGRGFYPDPNLVTQNPTTYGPTLCLKHVKENSLTRFLSRLRLGEFASRIAAELENSLHDDAPNLTLSSALVCRNVSAL